MLARQRQGAILDHVRHSGAVRVADLVAELGVSDMTIRRDLDALARRGLVDKVHGGATLPRSGSAEEPRFAEKSLRETAEKRAIAAVAAELVRPGDAIGLSAGTTTRTLALRLTDVPGLTVVTNSPPVADVFHEKGRGDQTVLLTGGLRTPSDALVGPFATAALEGMNLDLVFMGTHGMDARSGFSTPNVFEADANRALIASARRAVFVADHTKWGVVGVATVAPLSTADVLVTDSRMPAEVRDRVREHVEELLVADPVTGELEAASNTG